MDELKALNPRGEKALLVGPLPAGNLTGASISFQTLVRGFERAGMPHEVVDLTGGKRTRKPGSFDLARSQSVLGVLGEAKKKMGDCQVVYTTIASSRLGFLKDALLIRHAARQGKRIVVHLHGGGYAEFFRAQPGPMQGFIRATMAKTHRIIALGKLLTEQFEVLGDVQGKVRVVPNGLPDELNPAGSTPKTFSGGPFRLLYLSNLIPSKGYLAAFRAVRSLQEEGHDVELDLCGDFKEASTEGETLTAAEARDRLRKAIAEAGLEAQVRLRGIVRGEEKDRLLRECHAFVLPTTYPWEGQPISIIEAMAYHTPVISTAHRGIAEQVEDGVNGVVLPSADPGDIVSAVLRLMDRPERYAELSLGARASYETRFTTQAHLERLVAVIFEP